MGRAQENWTRQDELELGRSIYIWIGWGGAGGYSCIRGCQTYSKIKYEIKIPYPHLLEKAVLKEVSSNEGNPSSLLDTLLQGVDLLQAHAALILLRLTDGGLSQVNAYNVIPERRQKQHVVALPTAGNQGGLAGAVAPGREEVRAGSEHVGQGRGGAGAVPGGEGVGPQVLPG